MLGKNLQMHAKRHTNTGQGAKQTRTPPGFRSLPYNVGVTSAPTGGHAAEVGLAAGGSGQ